MILGNVNDADKGRKIRTTREVRINPWWEDEVVLAPVGTVGTVVKVESHGSNPYTRYTVAFGRGEVDRGRTSGMIPGVNFEWI